MNSSSRLRAMLAAFGGLAFMLYAATVSSAGWFSFFLPRGEVYLVVGPDTGPSGPTLVSFSVPAAQLGTGAAVAGSPPVQIEMGVRRPLGSPNITAHLTANTTGVANLVSGSNQIPISTISWTSTALTGTPANTQLIAGGAFTGAAQTIATVTTAGTGGYYAGADTTLRFANAQVYPAGTYTATISYTASSP